VNNGELLFLLGFDRSMNDKYVFTKYDSEHIVSQYGFNFIDKYSSFIKNYDIEGTNNDFSYVNKRECNYINNYLKTNNKYSVNKDLEYIDLMINSINSDNNYKYFDYLPFNTNYNINISVDLPFKDTNNFYILHNNNYYGLKKSFNSDIKNILPKIVNKLNIDKFIEKILYLNNNFIDTIAFLIYKYRHEEYIRYNLNDILPETSIIKIICKNDDDLYKIFFCNLNNYDQEKLNLYNENIVSFITQFMSDSISTIYNFQIFMYYALYEIDYELINDDKLFDNVQRELNIFSLGKKSKGNYVLLNENIFNYEYIIYYDKVNNKYYYNNSNNQILNEFETNFYIKDIEISDIYIRKNFKDTNYNLISDIKKIIINPKIYNFIKNLKSISNIFVWKSDSNNNLLIELSSFNTNVHFLCDLDKQTINFIIDSNEYEVITEYNYILGMLIYNSPNMYLIKKNEQVNILLFYSPHYYSKNSNKNYWINDSLFYKDYLYENNDINILSINHNLLTFNIKNDEYIKLMESFLINKNNFGIYLIIDNLKNISSEIFNSYKYDVQYVKLYNNKITNNKLNNHFEYEDEDFLTEYIIEPDNFNLENMLTINAISNKINLIKNIEHSAEHNKIIKSRSELKSYINSYRANCKNEYESLNTQIDEIYLNKNINIECYIKEIFEYIIFNNKIISFPVLYTKKYNLFYNIIIDKLYKICIKELKELKELEEMNCPQILKKIELLDYNEIFSLEQSRSIEDILFEIHTNYFIKKEQKNIVTDNILVDLSKNINNKVYEILMGKGKTTTITPLILINQIFKSSITNYNIILPKHLVPSSFDILIKYSQIFYKYSIKNQLYNNPNNISILSDSATKEYILTSIKSGTAITKLFSKNNLFIFDEIDTLIDSNKSDLNIPIDDTSHTFDEFIFKNILEIIKNLFNNKEINIDLINSTNPDDILILNPFKQKMKSVLKIISNMKYNQNYGFGTISTIEEYNQKYIFQYKTTSYITEFESDKNNFIAIPYSANNTPVDGSEFTDFELSISLTILTYLNNGLRYQDLYIIFKKLIKLLNNDIAIEIILCDFTNKELFKIIPQISKYDASKLEKWCKMNIQYYRYEQELILFYLQKVVLNNYFKISTHQYNISMIDLFDYNISTKKVAFSGTVNFYLLNDICNDVIKNNHYLIKKLPKFYKNLFSEIIPDNKSKGSIYSSIYGLTTRISTITSYLGTDTYEHMENKFIQYILNPVNLNKYDAIIDAGGLIIKHSSHEIVEKIYEQLITNLIDKTILFINDKDEKMIYYGPENIQKYNNEKINNLLIYYDHKHTIGIDFKQPAKMRGIVSVSINNTLTQISQAIFRLRNINLGHSVDFYADNRIFGELIEIHETSEPIMEFITQLLDHLIQNEQRYKLGTKYNLQIQFLKYLNRYLNKNIDSYKELIYYDLIQYNNKFITQEEFINQLIVKRIKEVVIKNEIILKNISYSYPIDKICTNIQLKKEISINININININTRIRSYYGNNIFKDIVLSEKHISLDNIITNSNSFQINSFDGMLNCISIKDWSLYFSPLNYIFLKKYDRNSRFYCLYDKQIPNSITIIQEDEYYNIINYDETNYTLKHYNIVIFNNYGDIVFNIGNNKCTIPNIIRILLFDIKFSTIEKFHYLTGLIKEFKYPLWNANINNEIYRILLDHFQLYYNYTILDDKVPPQFIDMRYDDIECWEKVFLLNKLSETQQKLFYDKIISKYILKYHIKTKKHITQIPHKIISDKIITIRDSPERFKPTNKSLYDSKNIILYDNDDFRLNNPAIFEAYPDNIAIRRNGLKLGSDFKIKQKILNIISFNGHDNIKLIDFTQNSLTFKSSDNPNKFIIYLNSEYYKNKYLKYKNKYLELKKIYNRKLSFDNELS
jgi:hypothetical protein